MAETQGVGPKEAFLFGGQVFPLSSLNKHALFLGATGSGKTISMRLLQQSFLSHAGLHGDEGGWRAVLYDAKLDMKQQLWELEEKLHAPIQLTNPFDQRSSRWSIAQDLTSPAAAFEIANILCPVNEGAAQPFFDRATVNLLSGVFIALHTLAPGNWDLRIVCLLMRSEHHLRELLGQTVHTRHLVRRYLQDGKLSVSVMATVESKMQPYGVIAALWSQATSTFSLRQFRDSECILILGTNEEAREPMNAINRVLVRRLTELLLAQSDSTTRRTLIVFDEIREAGELEGLSSLALRGRSKGVCLVAGAQDIEGLVHVYGAEVAHELLGQFGYKAILKLDNPNTVRWASALFATTEVREKNRQRSQTFGSEEVQHSHGVGETLRERDVVLPNEVLYLPPTSGKGGLSGFYKTPHGGFQAHYDFLSLLHRRPDEERRALPADFNFQERPESEQYLDDWTAAELARFGLTAVPPDDVTARPRERSRAPRGLNNNPNRGRSRNQSPQDNVEEEPDDLARDGQEEQNGEEDENDV